MPSSVAGVCLPTANDRVDVKRVNFEAIAAPPSTLRSHHRGPAAEEVVEHDVTAGGTVKYGVGDHRDRFHGGMQSQQIALLARAGKRVCPRIVPDVTSISAKLTELNVIAVTLNAGFEHENEFVLAPI